MDLAVMGAGYVGLVTAACMARLGHRVSIIESDPVRRDQLRSGRMPFFEPGLEALVSEVLGDGRLLPSPDPVAALGDSALVMICVGTPLGEDGAADLSQVRAACRTVSEAGGPAAVVVRSTLPLGATSSLAAWLGRSGSGEIVTNPEFLRQGTAVADFTAPSRVVIGTPDGSTTATAATLRDLYAPLEAPVVITDYASAEMIKNAANAFLAVRLSFVNEVADLCEAYGADIDDVVAGIGLDPRIGSSYLRPGIGFGGSCLPKELANLVRLGQRRGLSMPLLEGTGRVNDGRATRIVDRLEEVTGSMRGRRVGLLGLAFKPNTDDLRYSPAVTLAQRLLERGAVVTAHDPVVPRTATAALAELRRVPEASDAVLDAQLVVLATEWPAYLALDWARLAGLAAEPILFDGRNALDHAALTSGGWRVISVGRDSQSRERVD